MLARYWTYIVKILKIVENYHMKKDTKTQINQKNMLIVMIVSKKMTSGSAWFVEVSVVEDIKMQMPTNTLLIQVISLPLIYKLKESGIIFQIVSPIKFSKLSMNQKRM